MCLMMGKIELNGHLRENLIALRTKIRFEDRSKVVSRPFHLSMIWFWLNQLKAAYVGPENSHTNQVSRAPNENPILQPSRKLSHIAVDTSSVDPLNYIPSDVVGVLKSYRLRLIIN
jgi:hypothetical protein